MQRSVPVSRPPRQQENQGGAVSPALLMANRIRSEQGIERAREYLYAMEPFLAPGERVHIANALGLPAPQPRQLQYAPQSQPANNMGNMGGLNALGNLGGLGNIGNIMQLMQLMGGMQNGGSGGNQNPAQMIQMLSGLMGGKK